MHDEQHARNALLAALDMIACLDALQDTFKANGWPTINIGVGLNTGEMTVGNMGSEFRLAYTVMGDAVNLGSRLEALTKQKGCQLIISRDVADFAGWTDAARSGESIEVRGVAKPIEIIAVARGRDLPPQILGPGWSG